MSLIKPQMRFEQSVLYLHASIVDIESKIAISNLQWRRFVVNQICADDIKLRYDGAP